MNTLPVSYVSQLGAGAGGHGNDCGAASSLMLLRTYSLAKDISVDKFYDSIKPSGDVALAAWEMQNKMSAYGLKTKWYVGLTLTDVFDYLRYKKPILALVHYAVLVDAKVTEKLGFRGAHFIVITGIDLDFVYINDPYRTDNAIDIAVPHDIFLKAWKTAYLDGNPECGCLIPIQSIQDLSIPVPPTTDTYTFAIVNGIQINVLNVRSGPNEFNYPVIGTLWRTKDSPIHALASTLTNGYVQLSNLSGWVWFAFLKKI